MDIQAYQYDSKTIKSGILHVGVGNFHRAHQQFYTDQLLKNEDQQHWGICGVCLLPSDEKIVNNLRSQNLDYTLTICGRDGKDEIHKIGSLTELIWGIEDPKAVVDKIADRAIKIITLTITEGGYNLDKETNEFNLNDEKIKHDLENPENPTTVFGFIAEGLRKRKAEGNGSITILSCDNLQHNGNTAKRAFTTFIETQDKDLAEWVKTNVTFPNSMVDRITPATSPEDVVRLNKKSGIDDKAPVYCEDFTQWVIEDNFIAGRPAWEKVGVEFTQDVTAFENMKLSLLNASHMLLSYPSFLKGYRKVDEAMEDKSIVKFIRDFMDIDITPYVPAPENTDLEKYKQTLIERFSNKSVSDQVSRLCFDGISKLPVYMMPNLAKMINDDKDLTRVAFLFASYRHYLKYKIDDKGHSYEVAEPWINENDENLISSDDPIDFLGLSAFKSIDLKKSNQFVQLYEKFVSEIKNLGTGKALELII
ncbi:mannitol 2-dehydrogenase [Chryseobacterium ginsenosidimutans]|uniref:mannitol dehydrogenase family protein n=1 Tax=Chryseobacterium ginsenosidimutans TaxID=687846 RepID=UPI002169DE3E|nr:mannitol dehydrogenase family protein [Chryseobacterium ginsenosidimutans]MCS3870599.1 mannitol 2-dehydrogenase [Chryseobacterium ginsenosidimutans]